MRYAIGDQIWLIFLILFDRFFPIKQDDGEDLDIVLVLQDVVDSFHILLFPLISMPILFPVGLGAHLIDLLAFVPVFTLSPQGYARN